MPGVVNGQANVEFVKSVPRPCRMASNNKNRNMKINAKKQLPVYVTRSTQNKENGEVLVPTSVGKLSAGVEKAEEKEFHLQVAMVSQHAFLKGGQADSISIPIPRVEVIDDKVEANRIALMKERVRRRPAKRKAEIDDEDDSIASVSDFGVREDAYELDEEDDRWLKQMNVEKMPIKPDEFEHILEMLENNSRKLVLSLPCAWAKLPNVDRSKVELVYDYWIDKRTRLCKIFPFGSLIPIVPSELNYNDKTPYAYVAFQKREPDIRRRSVRIAINNVLDSSNKLNAHQKSAEEKEMEDAERLFDLSYRIDTNSEIDGKYAFERNPRCRYRNVRMCLFSITFLFMYSFC
ncbi:Enhancer of polycomb-like protein 1-like isoform X2 [Aphelenchoides besseyi]|nr:Enhancer of polycomb-like protein 1-like isoform X2 [Aphelenchoides besseyi]KAI6228277.1 Enhancer of polycomb-like protein 1-like isoform X2 [Aphelenchoides besseyi]